MDQLKPILAQMAKHQFWIVTGLGAIIAIVGFFMAKSTIDAAFDAQKSALDTHYSNIQTVRSAVPTHPNDLSKARMEEIVNKLAKDVEEAWRRQYERQVQILQWPEEIKETNLSLVRKLESYMPPEIKLEYPEEPAMISKTEKEAYARYFDDQMPRLAKIIGVEWVGEVSKTGGGMAGYGGAGMGPGMGAGMGYGAGGYGGEGYGGEGYGGDEGYGEGYGGGYGAGMGPGGFASAAASKPRDLVIWPKSSQDELINSIRLWTGETPTVYEILYTQENMWILEGLFNIIKKTNGNAQANFQTAVREIEFIRIGRPAVGRAGEIDGVASAAGGMYSGMGAGYGGGDYGAGGYGGGDYGAGGYGGEGYSGGEEGAGYGGGFSGGEEGAGYGPMTTVSRDPADNRYVDENFQPVKGEDLRTRMRSSSPEDAYFAVAKRVPVRMRFKVDQRRVLDLLANCGNADLMLEVRQVRLGDTAPAGAAGAAGGYGGAGMGPGMGPGLGGFGGDYGGGEYGGGDYGGEGYGGYGEGGYGGGMYGGAGSVSKADPYLLDVELYGVVYLYNPPDIERLGLNKVTAETQLDTTVDVETATPPEGGVDQPAAGGTDEPATGGDNAAEQGGANTGGPSGAPAGQPRAGQPGAVQPGAGQPRAGQPGAGQPGPGQPGAGQPRAGQPGGRPGPAGGNNRGAGAGANPNGPVPPGAQPGGRRPGAGGPGGSQPGPGGAQPGGGAAGAGPGAAGGGAAAPAGAGGN